jgi:hypothetical protein
MASGKKHPNLLHVYGFLLVAIISISCIYYEPKLVQDSVTALSTAGVFLTLYGLIVAIIEIQKAKSLAQAAKDAATRTLKFTNTLTTTKELTECQAILESSMASLDGGHPIPTYSLGRILALYSRLFEIESHPDDSPQRFNQAALQSYKHNQTGQNSKSHTVTRQALLCIMTDLGSFQGKLTIRPEDINGS